MVEKLKLQLTKKSYESERVERLSFAVLEPSGWSFLPGQFIVMLLEQNGKIHKRSYSLISKPNAAEVELVYTYLPGGVASEHFKNMQLGDTVMANGPQGKFIITVEAGLRYIWLATGTGIGPFCSMLQAVDFSGSNVEILFGIRSISDIICRDILEKDVNKKNIKLHYCCSRETNNLLNQEQYKLGYVQENLARLTLDPLKDRFYLCGNPAMVDTCATFLLSSGINPSNIHREKYVVSGLTTKKLL